MYISRNNQSGITLLLSIFIMAGLALIAVTVSSLAIQSIRNSRAVALSEPAMGAAHSGAEEGVWGIKRASTIPTCGTGSETAGSVSSARNYCKVLGAATMTLTGTNPLVLYLYDPDNVNTDLDLSGMQDNGFHDMTVTLLAGAHSVNVSLKLVSPRPDGTTNVGNPGSPVTVTGTPGSFRRITGLSGPQTGDPTSNDNRIAVTMVCGSCASSEQSTLTVDTDIGMPAYPTINSIGCAQRGVVSGTNCTAGEVYSRRIDVSVPQ